MWLSPQPIAAALAEPGSRSFELGGLVPELVFVACLLTAVVVIVSLLAHPWELRGGSFLDKLRIGEAVSRYDFWLSLRGVGSRRRRELRRELRANLWEAVQRVGARQALSAVGPTRRLAHACVAENTSARWGFGVAAALVALEVSAMVQILVSTVVVDTAQAAGAGRLDVAVTLIPGMRTVYEPTPGGGFAFETHFGPVPLVVAMLTFVVVSRPWRIRRRAALPTA